MCTRKRIHILFTILKLFSQITYLSQLEKMNCMILMKTNDLVQVNLCQKLLFLHQLTHNMTTDCSWLNSMNNLLSCGWLVDARISASEKDLPVRKNIIFLLLKKYYMTKIVKREFIIFGWDNLFQTWLKTWPHSCEISMITI